MKKTLALLALFAAVAVNAQQVSVVTQTNVVYSTNYITQTNLLSMPAPGTSSTLTQTGTVQNSFSAGLAQTGTWLSSPPYMVTMGAVIANGLKSKTGGYIGVFKPVITNSLVEMIAGTRIDYVDGGFWMPQLNGQLGVPLHPLKNLTFLPSWASSVVVTPFAFAGVGLPLSGAVIGTVTVPGSIRDNNGQPTGIIGEGFALRVYSPTNSTWGLDLVGDRETWSGFAGTQYRVGLLYNRQF